MKNFIQIIFIFIVTLLLFTYKTNAQNTNWAMYTFDWTMGFGGHGNAITVDSNGNSYVTGNFRGNQMFGNFNLTSNIYSSYQDVFIAKFDTSGNCIWAKQTNDFYSTVYSQGISVDANGNIYITGTFNPSAKFGNTLLTEPNQGKGCFIAKYDVNGNFIWAKQSGPNANSAASGTGISTDANGNSYITGYFQGAITFGNIQLTNNYFSSNYFFVAKYDVNGNCIWAKQETSNNSNYNAYGQGISVDANGNSYVTGYFYGITNFGNIQLISPNNNSFFMAKYDSNGNNIWATQNSGGWSNVRGYSTSVDAIGNSYVTGQFQGTTTFGNFQLMAAYGDANVFIAKYDVNGNCIWANQDNGTNNYAIGYGITVDKIGDSYVTGQFYGDATLGNIKMSAYNKAVFVAKYDNNGNCIWVHQTSGDQSSTQANGISVDKNGNSYITGIGGITLPGPGFIAKIISYPTFVLNTNSINFGATVLNSANQKTITIKDTSISTLSIDSIYTLTKRFAVNTTSGTVHNTDSLNVTVTFTPDTTGSFTDTLYIHNNSNVMLQGKSYN